MDNIAMLFLCLALGMALRKLGQVPDNAHVALNAFIVKIALPALILQQIHNVKFDPTMIYAVLMPWLLFAASAAIFLGHWKTA
jgi:malate permease and related proteins